MASDEGFIISDMGCGGMAIFLKFDMRDQEATTPLNPIDPPGDCRTLIIYIIECYT